MVGDNEQTLVAQTQPFALLRRRNHLPSFPSPHNVCQQGIPAIQDMGNGVDLVGPQGDLRVDPGKIDMAAVIFPRTDAVEFVIIEPCQPLPALRVFPYPILKRLLDERLFPLCDGGLFFVENECLGIGRAFPGLRCGCCRGWDVLTELLYCADKTKPFDTDEVHQPMQGASRPYGQSSHLPGGAFGAASMADSAYGQGASPSAQPYPPSQ